MRIAAQRRLEISGEKLPGSDGTRSANDTGTSASNTSMDVVTLYNVQVSERETKEETADDDAFARAMAEDDVVRLPADSRERVRAAPRIDLPPVATPPVDDDDESGEDFAAHGVNRREIRKLTRGEYAAADRRDLHGMTAAVACATVKQFLEASRHRHRCVCIVHGRGLRSPGGVAVLKARVREYLRSHPTVLAYADAPPYDGGAGAVYVLLRR